jgi:hypothetical protein
MSDISLRSPPGPSTIAQVRLGTKDKERAMSQTPNTAIAVIGIDIGKSRSGKAVYWRAALPLGHATTFAAARWRRKAT